MPRKRSAHHSGSGRLLDNVKSYDGRYPGDISDLIAERSDRAQPPKDASNDPLDFNVTDLDLLAELLSSERFVLSDKYSAFGKRYIQLWIEGEGVNSELCTLLDHLCQTEHYEGFYVENPNEHHPSHTTIRIGSRVKAAVEHLRQEGKIDYGRAERRSHVPAAFERRDARAADSTVSCIELDGICANPSLELG